LNHGKQLFKHGVSQILKQHYLPEIFYRNH
jgi:hypothetical protein